MQTASNEQNVIRRIYESTARIRKIQRDQAGRSIGRQRMRRQTFTIHDRFATVGQRFLAVFQAVTKTRKATANPIPAHLRPWTPSNARLLRKPGAHREDMISNLRECCTNSQWKHLIRQYPFLVHTF